MSGEQICLQVPPKLFGVNSWIPQMTMQAVNSILFVRRQKMRGSQRCYGELEELTVDDIWLIADAGDQ